MKPVQYAPARGDVVWLDFNPQVGREQAGRRPALVLSSTAYNRVAGLAVVCPITSRVKGYPFEVALPDGLPVTGVVLSDQAKSLDWHARNAAYLCSVPETMLARVVRQTQKLIVSGV